jgi:hypothetical protein
MTLSCRKYIIKIVDVFMWSGLIEQQIEFLKPDLRTTIELCVFLLFTYLNGGEALLV